MRNRVPQPDLDRGKKEPVGQKTCGGNQCPKTMPLPNNESRTVHNRHEPASSANAPGLDQTKMCLYINIKIDKKKMLNVRLDGDHLYWKQLFT